MVHSGSESIGQESASRGGGHMPLVNFARNVDSGSTQAFGIISKILSPHMLGSFHNVA